MIIGMGADIVSIERIRGVCNRFGDRFVNKCFTKSEIEKAKGRKDPVRVYAKTFAAKEAILKTLGTGMRAGLAWKDMQITNDDLGRPFVTLTGGVETVMNKLTQGQGKPIISISLSDEDAYALAFVVVEAG